MITYCGQCGDRVPDPTRRPDRFLCPPCREKTVPQQPSSPPGSRKTAPERLYRPLREPR